MVYFANSVCPLHGFQFNSKRIAKVGAASATGRKEAPTQESCSDRCIAKVGAASAEGRNVNGKIRMYKKGKIKMYSFN